jgi:hypothetical protein
MMSSASRSASLQVLGGEQQGSSVVDQGVEHRPELGSGARIEPCRGFVEEKDLGPGHQGRRQVEAPPHATGIAGGDPVGGIC